MCVCGIVLGLCLCVLWHRCGSQKTTLSVRQAFLVYRCTACPRSAGPQPLKGFSCLYLVSPGRSAGIRPVPLYPAFHVNSENPHSGRLSSLYSTCFYLQDQISYLQKFTYSRYNILKIIPENCPFTCPNVSWFICFISEFLPLRLNKTTFCVCLCVCL